MTDEGTGGEVEERPVVRRRIDWSGALRSLVLPLALVVLIVGGLWYWQSRGGGGGRDEFGTVALPTERNPTGQSPAPEPGRAGPDFILERPGGGTLRLSDLQGRPVMVNFWASWCPPCRSETPELVRAYEQYRDQGLEIVGVDLQETDSAALKFADDFGVTYPLVVDRDGDVADAWRLGGPIEGLPTTYFIDSSGVVQDFFYGPLTEEFLVERLAKILPRETG